MMVYIAVLQSTRHDGYGGDIKCRPTVVVFNALHLYATSPALANVIILIKNCCDCANWLSTSLALLHQNTRYMDKRRSEEIPIIRLVRTIRTLVSNPTHTHTVSHHPHHYARHTVPYSPPPAPRSGGTHLPFATTTVVISPPYCCCRRPFP